jgi:hypothetical protein
MKSRLPAPSDRATTARRMGRTLQEMATENATEAEPITNVIDGLSWSAFVAGGAAVGVLWQGAALTLGHIIVIAVGLAGAGQLVWRRFR